MGGRSRSYAARCLALRELARYLITIYGELIA
jgi:hypothetical protein